MIGAKDHNEIDGDDSEGAHYSVALVVGDRGGVAECYPDFGRCVPVRKKEDGR